MGDIFIDKFKIIDEYLLEEGINITREDIDALSVDFSKIFEEYLVLDNNKTYCEILCDIIDENSSKLIECLKPNVEISRIDCDKKIKDQLDEIVAKAMPNKDDVKIEKAFIKVIGEYLKSRNRKLCIVDDNIDKKELYNNGVTEESEAVKMTKDQFSCFVEGLRCAEMMNKVMGEDQIAGVSEINSIYDVMFLGCYMKNPDKVIEVIEDRICEMYGNNEEKKEEEEKIKADLNDIVKESNRNKLIFVSYILDEDFDEDKLISELGSNISSETIECFEKLRNEYLLRYKKILYKNL